MLAHSGFVLNATDAPLEAGSQPFTFGLYAAASGGSAEWVATCSLAVHAGYYAVTLGAAPCAGATLLDTADVPPGQARWLEVTLGTVTLAPRLSLESAATSVLAADAQKLGGVAAAGYLLKTELEAGGAGTVDAARLNTGTLPSLRLAGTYPGALSLTNAANVIGGDGATLTNLDASQLLLGTVPGGRLSGTYANALALSNAGNTYAGSGAGLTALHASALASGTVPSARLSGTYASDLTLTGAVAIPNGLAIPNGTVVPSPAGPAGSVFFKSDDAILYVSNGAAWMAVTGGGGTTGWPLGSSGNPAASCSAIKAALPAAATSVYDVTTAVGSTAVWCDMVTDGGGWTLVLAATDTLRWKPSNAAWNDASYDAGLTVTPSAPGKSLAYSQTVGDQLLFKTHNEAAGRWATFDLPSASTLQGLVGATNVMSLPAGTFQKTSPGAPWAPRRTPAGAATGG